jgi:radical SAM-linked protein
MKKQRYRIQFSKTDRMRFTGHLDLILTWERSFRRAGLPLAYSQGFSPRPVLNLAAPLPLGYTSTGELGDFWLTEAIPADIFTEKLTRALPPGIELREIMEIEDLHGKKLPSLVRSAFYQADLKVVHSGLEEKIAQLLGSSTCFRLRKNKQYDLRPLIEALALVENTSSSQLEMTLSMLPGATGRPDEVLSALEISPEQARICRTKIYLSDKEGS